jgi:uncharacterized integral membrane protein
MKGKTILVCIVILLISLSISKVMAPPVPPCAFHGYVYVSGKLAQDGLNVTAAIRGTALRWTTQTKGGTYGSWSNFYVPSDNSDTSEKDGAAAGDTIEFYVQGIKTNQVATFVSGAAKELDLSISGIPGLTPNAFLTVSVDCLSTYVGYKVKISGELVYMNGTDISGANVSLAYSGTGGTLWSNITTVTTAINGKYYAEWMPTAMGNYLIKVSWKGDGTPESVETEANVNLALTSLRETYVFSVISNSTLSELAFNSTSMVLSFILNGPSETTGYANVTVAKDLIGEIGRLKVYLDKIQANYTAVSTEASWLLHFTYQHSTHKAVVELSSPAVPFFETPLGIATLFIVIIFALAMVYMAYGKLTRHRRSARLRSLKDKQFARACTIEAFAHPNMPNISSIIDGH